MSTRRRRQRGTGEVFAEGTGWAVRWREGGKRRYKAGFANRADAQRVLDKIRGDLALGKAGLRAEPRALPALAKYAEPFLEARKRTHRAGAEDASRWKKHVAPYFGHLRPCEVGTSQIRDFINAKLQEGANPAMVRIYVAILSALFNRLVEDGEVEKNPALALPKSVRRLVRPTHDPKTTPFLERAEDVRRVYLALPVPLNVAFAIGALAGLRTGEVFALRWQHVDLAARRIHVRESVKGPLKDKDSRVVPILDPLLPVLSEWKLAKGGAGEARVIPPLRRDGKKIDKHTPGLFLGRALTSLGLARPNLGWYECTRHTFASQWVMAGGSIEKLKEILGHYSVVMTERYAHLKPELFTPKDLGTLSIDLAPGSAEAVEIGQTSARSSNAASATARPHNKNAGAVL